MGRGDFPKGSKQDTHISQSWLPGMFTYTDFQFRQMERKIYLRSIYVTLNKGTTCFLKRSSFKYLIVTL